MPQIEVKFDIDANGILNVSAKDLGTGKEQTRAHRAVERPVEARNRARCARTPSRTPTRTSRSAQLAEQRNQADSMCCQVEKLIKEHDAKLEPADKAPLEAAIEKTREAAKGDDVDAIKSADQRVGAGLARLEQDAVRVGAARPAPRRAGGPAAGGDGKKPRRGRGHRRRVRGEGVTARSVRDRACECQLSRSECARVSLGSIGGVLSHRRVNEQGQCRSSWHFASTN